MNERDNQSEKELSLEDLESVAGGQFVEAGGIEIDETEGGNKGVRID